jgi:hypothetical protein
MDVAHPKIASATAVLSTARVLASGPGVDEELLRGLQSEFQNVVLRQPPVFGGAADGPRLIVTSTSSQLVVTSTQAELEVRFYGEYLSNPELCISYLLKKIEAVRKALTGAGIVPAMMGVVVQAQFTCKDTDVSPTEHILNTHLKLAADPKTVEDAVARVAVKVNDKYFVSLRVANYESRTIQRPMLPGNMGQPIIMKPWDGVVDDYGIGLTVDINNILEGKVLGSDPEVTDQGVRALLDLVKHALTTVGPGFVDTGSVDPAALLGEPA